MAESSYSNTILIVKPVGPDAAASLRSMHNINRLKSFHFEQDVNSTADHNNNTRSRECTPYVSRPPELHLLLELDPGPEDVTQGFIFGANKRDCDVQLLENPDPDPNSKYGISRKHFRIDFNWKSGFLRLNNMSSTNGTGMTAPSVNNGYQLLEYTAMHMLHPLEQTKVHVGNLVFEISFPARGMYQRQYDWNWDSFRAKHGMAVPNIDRLDIQPIIEVTPFVQRRKGRLSTYLLHGEIGKGEYGIVCRANDPLTGELYAAKQFMARKPGWDAKAYLEIAISHDITHEHIVGFVDSIDDGGGPVLVMEYMPLGNLTQVKKISKEEMRTVLRQALQALTYLHDEKNITHRDIKPENILVRSRTPEMFIKLCDFGLSTESSFLKTICGTGLYAAAEIFTGSYTKSVDIWAMGVLGYQFIQGLPAPPENLEFKKWPKEWSKRWSKRILDSIDRPRRQNDDPAISLLRSMVEPNPKERPSAKACLSHPWIQNVSPLSRPCLQQTNVGPRSLQTISEIPTDIWDPQMQLEGKMPAPTPGVLRKRLRSSESITSRTQPSKRGAKKIQTDKSLESNVRGLLTEATVEHDRGHRVTATSGHATCASHVGHERKRASNSAEKALPRTEVTTGQSGQNAFLTRAQSAFKQALPEPDAIAVVLNWSPEHVQMRVEGQIVFLRKADGFLNATQIIKLAKKDKNERRAILETMKKYTKVDVKDAANGSWVNLHHARILCKHLGLERQLQPLLDHAQKYTADDVERALPVDQDYLSETGGHQFVAVPAHPEPVMVRFLDFKVNATHILKVAGQERQMHTQLQEIKRYHHGDVIDLKGGVRYTGTYVALDIAMGLCQKYGLLELESRIRRVCSHGRITHTIAPSKGIDTEVQPGDIAGQTGASLRPDSALPQQWGGIQQAEPVSPRDHSGPGDDQFQGNDTDEEYSSRTSKERETEHPSFRPGTNTAPLHQRTRHSLRETNPPLPRMVSYYKISDYQPQYSHLSRVELSLKPPDKTASPHESFTDFC